MLRNRCSPSLRIFFSYINSIAYSLVAIKWRLLCSRRAYISIGAKILGWRSLQIGVNSCISSGTTINSNLTCADACRIVIGNNVFLGRNCFVSCGDLVTISDYCLISDGCKIIGASHSYSEIFASRASSAAVSLGNIKIGVNVFIGSGSIVIGNVSIGHGSVIAAGSLVLHSIPAFCVYGGSPAKLIKYFDPSLGLWVKSQTLSRNDKLLLKEDEYLSEIDKRHSKQSLPLNYSRYSYSDN